MDSVVIPTKTSVTKIKELENEENLISFLNSKARLLEYSIENDVLFLNFNEYLFDSNDKILEEVMYTISYSIFDNYDVNQVLLQVDGKNIETIGKKDLP